jgi:hypothetical protein
MKLKNGRKLSKQQEYAFVRNYFSAQTLFSYLYKPKEMKRIKNSLNTNPEAKLIEVDFMAKLSYPAGEDIYNKSKQEFDIDPENISALKESNESVNESEKITEAELDVPGSELDDQQEKIGSEDEENNYYSLGLDNHNELEENRE